MFYLDNARKSLFFFALSSLNRISGWRRRYFRSTMQRKTDFFFVLSSLNRIFAGENKVTRNKASHMVLSPELLDFMRRHADDDVRTLALHCTAEELGGASVAFALDQIRGRQMARRKLPTWAATEGVIFPPHLAMEQCSSEATARYKEGLPPSLTGRAEEGLGQGGSFVDLTGGFGVDFSYMSRGFQRRVYVERDEGLCEIARENFRRLGLEAEVVCGDGVEYLRQMERVDVIFLDPARRDSHGQRTYAVSDCTPDVTAIQGLLREKARRVIIKLSPMLDWRQVTRELEGVTEVHIVATGGECKELVVVMEAEGDGGCDRVATYTTPQVVCAGLRVICADLEGDCWVVP